ncbi:FecCD family ABC transporter permease [Deinococcus cellulosilyticus]|uniref:Iron ABC transporter permease n=1 Tax=Deinococcus cellulosilyticus (strain DSM 18568 / NBRC 106333 / KACC 11606 / 5516J-15) TaxID=1223518 RepID=A0A511MWZ9_DEIC1|nr:iron ABC transporter permease [Deinococcus cellulosilyticus]GEM44687.1 iron ABC transporter permease [Deinococcus cellulosilyticus NBRC 106333 = KACC 11606]
MTARTTLYLLILLAFTLLLSVLALGMGTVHIPAMEVVNSFTGKAEELYSRIVLELRLPRILTAALTGAMFAASGVILQGVVRNPLAAPDVIGVNAGAALAAVLVLLVIPASPSWLLPWGAFLGAWVGFACTYLLSRMNGQVSPARLALVGIAVGAALGSVEQLILVRAPDGIAQALSFLSGTIYAADYTRVYRLLPWAALLLPLSLILSRYANLLSLGDASAVSLGVRLERMRAILLTLAVGLAAAAVTGAGLLGFVGLIAPHMARLMVGPQHQNSLPVSMLVGALLVIGADTLGRSILPPIEIPAGLLTTLLGAPYFLYLLKKNR